MTQSADALTVIAQVDLREGGPRLHAQVRREQARALRDACLTFLPGPARACLPAFDGVTRRWLLRSRSPYVADADAVATALGFSGVWFLNGCYQWGCTAQTREEDGVPWLARTLDWPFPGLGRHAEVAHLRGAAGEFHTVTWPGYVGVLTGMAHGRFAAAINQAPLWRRTRAPWLRLYDIAANARRTWRLTHVPPDHLLRAVFETCRDYAEARRRLESEPVARPVIYSLAGCRPGEACTIERTEDGFTTRETDTAAANDWHERRAGWEGRVTSRLLFTETLDGACERSRLRREALADWDGRFADGGFAWVRPPVLNPFTRIAVEMCPARGVLRVRGYESVDNSEPAMPVTETFATDATRLAA